jgi:hypothetical protein
VLPSAQLLNVMLHIGVASRAALPPPTDLSHTIALAVPPPVADRRVFGQDSEEHGAEVDPSRQTHD